jgi:hypothetical protein
MALYDIVAIMPGSTSRLEFKADQIVAEQVIAHMLERPPVEESVQAYTIKIGSSLAGYQDGTLTIDWQQDWPIIFIGPANPAPIP